MAQTNRYVDTPIDPISLNGVNHADQSLADRLRLSIIPDLVTNSDYFLYVRVDTEPTAGATVALFKPVTKLVAGQAFEFDVDPGGGFYLHTLLTDSAGAVTNGGENDRILIFASRANP